MAKPDSSSAKYNFFVAEYNFFTGRLYPSFTNAKTAPISSATLKNSAKAYSDTALFFRDKENFLSQKSRLDTFYSTRGGSWIKITQPQGDRFCKWEGNNVATQRGAESCCYEMGWAS
ncbi:hypothetical protein [Candidatus Electronema sp. PJ]|uniref:hypothetical protein n=1 Tax=Candidatus Electronema sp. PJ TaxID=3401572 RepID=UPI003AA80338